MCAMNFRGRRVNYDNIAVGSPAGVERTLPLSTSDSTREDGTSVSDPSLYNPDGVSVFGDINTGIGAGFTNISVGNRPGIEDIQEGSANPKITSAGENVAD